jgi:hypothetical protein
MSKYKALPILEPVNEREGHPGGSTIAALIRSGSEIGLLRTVCPDVKVKNSVPRDWPIVRLADESPSNQHRLGTSCAQCAHSSSCHCPDGQVWQKGRV